MIANLAKSLEVWTPTALSLFSLAVSFAAIRRTTPPPKTPRGWTEVVGHGEKGSTYLVCIENHTDKPFGLLSLTSTSGPFLISIKNEGQEGFHSEELSEIKLNKQLLPNELIKEKFAIPILAERTAPAVKVHLSTGRRYRKRATIEIPILIPERT
ncbi:hypothetical protein ACFP4H_19935 [Pseudophaeobacter arcticus]|jgi:hypothetical protein|uniref:hypothetical protein n=1 Tax=Pseudophaeobacter arcticus TaxID=385492 RepID=UPI0004893F7C|nr:hypothetical protein [Pseudophaeobacter arcticus]